MKKTFLAWWLICGAASQGFDPKDIATGIFDNTPSMVKQFETQEEVTTYLEKNPVDKCTLVEGEERPYGLTVEETIELKPVTTKSITVDFK